MKRQLLRPTLILAFCFWIGLIAGGYAWLLHYSFAPGNAAVAPHTLPKEFISTVIPPHPQLIVALHPRCPCSRATLAELGRILRQAGSRSGVSVEVLMYRPSEDLDAWMAGPLLEECQRMNWHIRSDPDGKLAASFGSLTSGSVLLYDSKGRLRYQGGITASRGHEGENLGQRAVVEILEGIRDSQPSMPVFGCPIQQELISRN